MCETKGCWLLDFLLRNNIMLPTSNRLRLLEPYISSTRQYCTCCWWDVDRCVCWFVIGGDVKWSHKSNFDGWIKTWPLLRDYSGVRVIVQHDVCRPTCPVRWKSGSLQYRQYRQAKILSIFRYRQCYSRKCFVFFSTTSIVSSKYSTLLFYSTTCIVTPEYCTVCTLVIWDIEYCVQTKVAIFTCAGSYLVSVEYNLQ